MNIYSIYLCSSVAETPAVARASGTPAADPTKGRSIEWINQFIKKPDETLEQAKERREKAYQRTNICVCVHLSFSKYLDNYLH